MLTDSLSSDGQIGFKEYRKFGESMHFIGKPSIEWFGTADPNFPTVGHIVSI